MSFTKSTLVYTAACVGQTPAALALLMNSAAVPVDSGLLSLLGGSITADNTVAGSASVTRTIEWTFDAQFLSSFPATSDQTAPFLDLLTAQLQAATGGPVLASAPVLA